MKIKLEYVALVLVIAAVGVYLALKRGDQVQYQIPDVPPLAAETITRIEISASDATVVLQRGDDDVWTVGEEKHKADAGKTGRIVDVVATLSLATLVAESEDYSRFALDPEQRLSVKAWAGEELKRAFDVGKAANTFRHTFVKLADDARVFHADKNFQEWFRVSAEDLRDKHIMRFDTAAISTFTLTHQGQSDTFTRTPEAAGSETAGGEAAEKETPESTDAAPATQWQNQAGLEADSGKIAALLAAVSTLECRRYQTPAPTAKPVLELSLSEGENQYQLTIFPKIEIDGEALWPAASSQSADDFYLADWKVKEIIKAPDTLLASAAEDQDKGDK